MLRKNWSKGTGFVECLTWLFKLYIISNAVYLLLWPLWSTLMAFTWILITVWLLPVRCNQYKILLTVHFFFLLKKNPDIYVYNKLNIILFHHPQEPILVRFWKNFYYSPTDSHVCQGPLLTTCSKAILALISHKPPSVFCLFTNKQCWRRNWRFKHWLGS